MKDQEMTFFDQLETRSIDQRASDIAAALPKQIARAKALAGYADAFSDVDPTSIAGVDALVSLPVLRKSDLSHKRRLPAIRHALSRLWSGLSS